MSKPTIVCILGMHRSGTSLVSRVLNVLGVYLGPEEHLMRPSTDNPTGHWESRPIKEINDEILSILGGSWSEPPPLQAGWERSPELAGPGGRAREVIEDGFLGLRALGIQGPPKLPHAAVLAAHPRPDAVRDLPPQPARRRGLGGSPQP